MIRASRILNGEKPSKPALFCGSGDVEMNRKQVKAILDVDLTFERWREAYRKVYGQYPKIKLVEEMQRC